MEQSNKSTVKSTVWLYFLIIMYITAYSGFSIWLLFDGWINNFSALHYLWRVESGFELPDYVQLALTTSLGAVLGGAILSVVSFHRYVAIEKSFEPEHGWGFLVMPLLSIIIGLVVYSLVQGGLLILSGSITEENSPKSAHLGFTAIGCISGYNWDKVASQLQKLSNKVFGGNSDTSD